MADLPPFSTPHWVKILGIIALALVLLFGILHLTGVGNLSPGRHMPSGDAGDRAPVSITVTHRALIARDAHQPWL